MGARVDRSILAITTSLSLLLVAGAARGRSPVDARIDTLERRIAMLESQLSAVSPPTAQGGPGSTVKAPFTVTDDAGKPIFTVRSNPRGFAIDDANGATAIAGSALPAANFVKVINAQQNRVALIGADASTSRLVLRDKADADRATFIVGPDGRPTLTLKGDSYKPITELSTVPETRGGQLAISNANGKRVAFVSALTDGAIFKAVDGQETRTIVMGIAAGRAALSVRDGADVPNDRAVLELSADGKTDFRILNNAHTRTVEVTQEEAGGGRINLNDPAGKPNVSIGALPIGGYFKAQTPSADRIAIIGTETGAAVVTLRDGSKTPRATLAITSEGKPTLTLFNHDHNGVVNLTEGSAGAGIFQLFDAEGETTVEGGTLPSGKGIVRVGPQFKCGGTMGGLTAADCIVGHKP